MFGLSFNIRVILRSVHFISNYELFLLCIHCVYYYEILFLLCLHISYFISCVLWFFFSESHSSAINLQITLFKYFSFTKNAVF